MLYLPINALHDGRQHMVERYRNVVFTPASAARLKDQPSAEWRGLGFGVSKALLNFPALPAVPEELHGIFRDAAATPAATDGAHSTDGVLAGQALLDDAFNEASFKTSLR